MPYFYDHLVRTFSNFHHFYQFLKGIYYVSVIFIGFLINSAVFRGESLHDLNSLKFTETFFKANHLKNLKKKYFRSTRNDCILLLFGVMSITSNLLVGLFKSLICWFYQLLKKDILKLVAIICTFLLSIYFEAM